MRAGAMRAAAGAMRAAAGAMRAAAGAMRAAAGAKRAAAGAKRAAAGAMRAAAGAKRAAVGAKRAASGATRAPLSDGSRQGRLRSVVKLPRPRRGPAGNRALRAGNRGLTENCYPVTRAPLWWTPPVARMPRAGLDR
jgi:hypothetical protein